MVVSSEEVSGEFTILDDMPPRIPIHFGMGMPPWNSYMAELGCTIRNRRHDFRDLKDLMAKATPLRSGDVLAGVAAETQEERVAAQMVLADVPLQRFLDE